MYSVCIIDEDQCDAKSHTCDQLCVFTEDEYHCECRTGYTRSILNNTCDGNDSNLYCILATVFFLSFSQNKSIEIICENKNNQRSWVRVLLGSFSISQIIPKAI